jgi:hypothetical protein
MPRWLDAALGAASCCFWILPGSIPIDHEAAAAVKLARGAAKRRGYIWSL